MQRAAVPDKLPSKNVLRVCGTCGVPRIVYNGARLRGLRQQAGISLRAMARRLKLSAAYICDVELNRRKPNEKIVAAYEALDA